MIMCTFKEIAVSSWELYRSFHGEGTMEEYVDFLAGLASRNQSDILVVQEKRRMRNAAEHRQLNQPDILIVREKKLSEAEYVKLFTSLWEKARGGRSEKEENRQQEKREGEIRLAEDEKASPQSALIIPHTYPLAARAVHSQWLHLPLSLFREYQKQGKLAGLHIGTSVHSLEEAREAQRLGASYITAGHIFTTDCKKGVPPRGISFLEHICAGVTIPVYAIGGIHRENLSLIRNTRAAGACGMSEYMKE